jgi:hypothetical protein
MAKIRKTRLDLDILDKFRLDQERTTERRTAAVARVRAYIAAREASAWEPKDFVDKENGAELTLADLIEIVRDAT